MASASGTPCFCQQSPFPASGATAGPTEAAHNIPLANDYRSQAQ